MTKNMVPGESVYGEKRVSVEAGEGEKTEYRVWNPFRSKLAASVLAGVDNVHIKPGAKVCLCCFHKITCSVSRCSLPAAHSRMLNACTACLFFRNPLQCVANWPFVRHLPALRPQVLYLGAASGTSVSHVSDIVGKDGTVYAVEFSHRSGPLSSSPLRFHTLPEREEEKGTSCGLHTLCCCLRPIPSLHSWRQATPALATTYSLLTVMQAVTW